MVLIIRIITILYLRHSFSECIGILTIRIAIIYRERKWKWTDIWTTKMREKNPYTIC